MTSQGPAFRTDYRAGVLTLSLTRPEAGNAITAADLPELLALLEGINGDARVRAVLVRGEGRNFCSGGDLQAFNRSLEQRSEERRTTFGERLELLNRTIAAYLTIEVPIIAMCRGAIAGAGLVYALGADLVLADETVRFMFVQQRVGLSPDGAVSYLLPRMVGLRRARELILGAAIVDAAQALHLGLVSRMVAADALEEQARLEAQKFAGAAQGALRRAKRLLGASFGAGLDEQLAAERQGIMDCVAEPDFEEGVRALLGKRAPRFPSASGED